jgi:hypothetical protein
LSLPQAARPCYLRLSVDAFLNHDFRNASAFYDVYQLATCAQAARSLPLFLQGSLALVRAADIDPQQPPRMPWNTDYVAVPDDLTEEEFHAPYARLLEGLHDVATEGEGALLALLLADDLVYCSCLNYEDPYHEGFQKVDLSTKPMRMSKKKHSYTLDCKRCGAVPEAGVTFPQCVGCKRCATAGASARRRRGPSTRSCAARRVRTGGATHRRTGASSARTPGACERARSSEPRGRAPACVQPCAEARVVHAAAWVSRALVSSAGLRRQARMYHTAQLAIVPLVCAGDCLDETPAG